MTEPVLSHAKDSKPGVDHYLFWCPGCQSSHAFTTPRWTFNGDMERPTVSPSLLTRRPMPSGQRHCCHLFITDGQLRFLSDCDHEFAGKTVPIPPLPERLR